MVATVSLWTELLRNNYHLTLTRLCIEYGSSQCIHVPEIQIVIPDSSLSYFTSVHLQFYGTTSTYPLTVVIDHPDVSSLLLVMCSCSGVIYAYLEWITNCRTYQTSLIQNWTVHVCELNHLRTALLCEPRWISILTCTWESVTADWILGSSSI